MYKSLKQGDTIGVVGVANSVYRENRSGDFERAKKLFLEKGFKLKFASNCLKEYYGMAGTPKEKAKELMKMFMDNPGKALSREDILNTVWGRDYFGELKIVDVNIRRLRIKIEDDSTNPTYITTVWGYGYKWGL